MNINRLQSVIMQPLIPKLLTGFFCILIVLELMSGLFSQVIEMELDATVEVSPPKNLEKLLLDPIWQTTSLFGQYIPKDTQELHLKRAKTPERLVGIIAGSSEDDSVVILQLPNKEQKVYHVGDRLTGGAVIQRIQKDTVYVLNHGELEYLFLPESNLIFGAPSAPLNVEGK